MPIILRIIVIAVWRAATFVFYVLNQICKFIFLVHENIFICIDEILQIWQL